MRLGLHSYNPIVWVLDALGILPTPLIVAFWGMESSRALMAAVELGVFDALAAAPRSAEVIAEELGLDAAGTESLLNALNGFGYLKHRQGAYSLRRSARRWLVSDARHSMARPFGLLRVVWDELGELEDRLQEGGKRDFHRPERDEAFWRRYETGLGEFGRLTGPLVARKVRFARAPRRLLDVGGGHGAYSAAFCERYPQLQATVLDLPPAAEVGRALVAERGLSDRISYLEGDLRLDEWGDGYDAVLLFNVLHVLSAEAAAAAIRGAYDALSPGGTLVVLDSAHRSWRGDVSAVGGGSELLFYALNNTRTYPEEQMVRWMRDAGFGGVRRSQLLAVPEAILTAAKPA
jgi:SAM-dependent methyltransferase